MGLLPQLCMYRHDALNLLQGKAQKWFPTTSQALQGAVWCSCASVVSRIGRCLVFVPDVSGRYRKRPDKIPDGLWFP